MTVPNHLAPALPPPLLPVEIKALVRCRDGYRCTECGMSALEHITRTGRNLQVHRIVPGSAYTVDGCVTLCRTCHGSKPKSRRGSQTKGSGLVKLSGPSLATLYWLCYAAGGMDPREMIRKLVLDMATERGYKKIEK